MNATIYHACPSMDSGEIPVAAPADRRDFADWAEASHVGRRILGQFGCVRGAMRLADRAMHFDSYEILAGGASERAAIAHIRAVMGPCRIWSFQALKPARKLYDAGGNSYDFTSPLGPDSYCHGPLLTIGLNEDGTRGAVIEAEAAHPEFAA